MKNIWKLSIISLSGIIVGILIGIFLSYNRNLPRIEELERTTISESTQVFADDGSLIGGFSVEKRIIIPSFKIPDVVKKAFVTSEDKDFYRHFGFSLTRIIKALLVDIRRGKRIQGASTITQQLARMLFLTREKTIKRKVREILLAIQVERKYTKDQIITFYLNNIYLGHGIYGVEAASRFYFGKHTWELEPHEAATLAALPSSPARLSPYVAPKKLLFRRNRILLKMADEGYITKKAAAEEVKKPLDVINIHTRESKVVGAYFLEEVRKYIAKKYGEDIVYRGGLKIYTTMNLKMEKAAEEALKFGLKKLDRRRGWRHPKVNLLKKGEDLKKYKAEQWKLGIYEGETYPAVVLSVSKSKARLKIGEYRTVLTLKEASWTKTNSLRRLFRKGDIINVKIDKKENKNIKVSLDQIPEVEGALIAIENKTGEIKAMVGGYSFEKSQFNRAMQAMRQTGSSIKPIIYSEALENGWTPASIIIDEPVSFIDPWTGEVWEPKNYHHIYKGWVTLRRGLEESRNVITAKLVAALTPEKVVEYAKKFGITSDLKPYLSIALGSFEVKLVEMTSAFTVFPNQGIRIEPYFIRKIEDRYGNILEISRKKVHVVIPPEIAYQMTYIMQGVVQRGTAQRAKVLKRSVGGKTGTTDEYTDAWFIGFTPSLTAGTWVGFDVKKSLGEDETGSRAALPIWVKFMQETLKDKPVEKFQVPPNIIFVKIDSYTGKLAMPFCLHLLDEAFIPGTEPREFCSEEDHLHVLDYYHPITPEE